LNDCVFCKIALGVIATNLVAESKHSVAFRDMAPRQPLHVLVVPKVHYKDVSELAFSYPEALVDLIQLGSKVAADYSNGSFRLTFNTGVEAGQSVFHAHGHITSTTLKDAGGN